jgi:hypothetical protein
MRRPGAASLQKCLKRDSSREATEANLLFKVERSMQI